jgi:hypothetical protein
MEDVLNVLARPYAIHEPVVTFDERPVALRGASRAGRSMAPGRIAREDYEYAKGRRTSTASSAPGRRHRRTRPRKGLRFVAALQRIASARMAKTIHLIADNLNLHGPRPPQTLGASGERPWARFTPHYTPTRQLV